MCCADATRKRDAKWRIDLAIHDAVGVARKRSIFNSFERLLAMAVSRSELLRPQPVSGRADWLHAALTLRGLLALCQHRKNWVRDVEDWHPTESGLRRQFGSLARHLLARCDVPGFMTQVWFEAPSPTATWHQKLFKHLGAGGNIRGAKLPIVLTSTAHLVACFDFDYDSNSMAARTLRGVKDECGTDSFFGLGVGGVLGRVFGVLCKVGTAVSYGRLCAWTAQRVAS